VAAVGVEAISHDRFALDHHVADDGDDRTVHRAEVDPGIFSSKSDVAYHELRRMILSGELPAGSRLAQYVLAEKLHMSITPLREAIRRLSSEGLIELDNHKDARVSTISALEARQLFEVRLALDPAAVELAAERRTDDDIALMRARSHDYFR
jgi:DNA-binding GntR family transcriptional regulator